MFSGEYHYTYCVQRHNEVIWEHFAYKGRLTEKGNNRCLKLPSDFKQGKLQNYASLANLINMHID
jgi:hypothetical protein